MCVVQFLICTGSNPHKAQNKILTMGTQSDTQIAIQHERRPMNCVKIILYNKLTSHKPMKKAHYMTTHTQTGQYDDIWCGAF